MNPAFIKAEASKKETTRFVHMQDEVICPTCESHKVDETNLFECKQCGETWTTVRLQSM